MSVLNELSGLTLIQGRFEFPVTLSLFDVFELFGSLLLRYEFTVVHILFLEMHGIFPPGFLLYDVNAITIYFTLVWYCLNTIKIKLENGEDVQCHEHRVLIDLVINIMMDSIIF